ncbi:MAG: hypothetical protein RI885_509 [Actinomycetota bacterium]|jgi:putative endonuclease
MAHVYILECADGSFYTGSTLDLEARLWQHQRGLGANFTRARLPVSVAFVEWTDDIEAAFHREKQIQGWSRAKKIALIEGRHHELPALSRPSASSEGPRG